jgi:hypothetical protein
MLLLLPANPWHPSLDSCRGHYPVAQAVDIHVPFLLVYAQTVTCPINLITLHRWLINFSFHVLHSTLHQLPVLPLPSVPSLQ